ncbi:MAG: tRNA lysidine(34) synthetase TilS [Alphaproteobacteria bacterium]
MTGEQLTAQFSEQLDRLTGLLTDAPKHVALAVSGGPDSMALALLARDWARLRMVQVTAFIVDHGLRSDSAEEAALVQSRLAGLEIAAHVLTPEPPLPPEAGQAAARDARYAALTAAMRDHQAPILLSGHHLDDQIETYRMRADKESGLDGLAGISALRLLDIVHGDQPELVLLRPLLGVRHKLLANWIEQQGVPVVRDPSNTNPRFDRARLRADPLTRSQETEIIAHMAQAAQLRIAAEKELTHQIGRADFGREGWASLPFGVLDWTGRLSPAQEDAKAQAGRLIRHLCQYLSGADRAPRLGRSLRVLEQLVALGEGAQGTLGGMILQRRQQRLLIARENRKWADRMILPRGRPVIFDRRFEVTATAAMPAGLTLGVTGRKGWQALRGSLDYTNPALGYSAPVIFSLPCLYDRSGQPVRLAFDAPDWLTIRTVSRVPRLPRGFVSCLQEKSPYIAV